MKNKKGLSGVNIFAIILLSIIAITVVVGVVYFVGFAPQTGVGGGGTTDEIISGVKEGDASSFKVYVSDASSNNINTKLAVPVYCQNSKGNFIFDGTSSSTTAEISATTTVGETITCWAFNATTQTVEPVVKEVDSEIENVVIPTFQVATSGLMEFFSTSPEVLANGGASNVTITGEGSDSFGKMRFKNNQTDKWIPLGGFYLNVPTGTNISGIDLVGESKLFGITDNPSASVVVSDLSTKVVNRKDNWDYVFEVDDSAEAGNQVLILEENDYLETSPVVVTSDVGCDAVAENLITGYGFTKGFYRSTKASSVLYGHETDASSASVISTDLTGTTVYCDN